MAFHRLELELLALLGSNGLVQAEGDNFAAQLRSGVDGEVAVGKVGFPVALLDDAAADGGDGWEADAYV